MVAKIFLALTLAAAAIASQGCTRTCATHFDCGDEGYCSTNGRCAVDCYTDNDCRNPPSCENSSGFCQPLGFRCDSFNRCKDYAPAMIPTSAPPPLAEDADGFNDPPGSGYTFIVDRLAIAGRGVGFDIDGSCTNGVNRTCADNALADLGDYGNDHIRLGVQTGQTLLLIEIAGIDEPYDGNDRSVTVKIYAGLDADDPPLATNNFSPLPGTSSCCDFRIAPGSLNVDQRPRSVLPAMIVNGDLIPLRGTDIEFALAVGDPPYTDVRFENAFIGGHLKFDLTEITTGLLGGAVPMYSLATTSNPYCKMVGGNCTTTLVNSSILDLVTALISETPDVDLDGNDGIECVLDTSGDGLIDTCCDGAAPSACSDAMRLSCTGNEIGPVDPADVASCVKQPQMADGYSVAIDFTAVRAHIVGQ